MDNAKKSLIRSAIQNWRLRIALECKPLVIAYRQPAEHLETHILASQVSSIVHVNRVIPAKHRARHIILVKYRYSWGYYRILRGWLRHNPSYRNKREFYPSSEAVSAVAQNVSPNQSSRQDCRQVLAFRTASYSLYFRSIRPKEQYSFSRLSLTRVPSYIHIHQVQQRTEPTSTAKLRPAGVRTR